MIALQETNLPPDMAVPGELLQLGYSVAARSDEPMRPEPEDGPLDLGPPFPPATDAPPRRNADGGARSRNGRTARRASPRTVPRLGAQQQQQHRLRTCRARGEARESQCRGCRSKKACSNKQPLLPPEPARQQQPAPEPTQGPPEEEPNPSQGTPPPPPLLGPFRDVPRTERTRGCVLILTRKDVAYDPMPAPYRPVRDRTTYIGAVAIHYADKTFHIINIYSPPARWTEGQGTQEQNIEINRLNTPNNCIIVGDLNAHAATWEQHQRPSQLGITIEDWTVGTGLMVLNDGSHTRVNPATGGRSTPDITLATPAWERMLNGPQQPT